MARSPRRSSRAHGGGRLYTLEHTGERLWSVTTIIDGAIPKSGLKWWAARTVAEFAYDESHIWLGMTRDRAVDYLKREPLRYTGSKADLGSAVHAAAEAIALGKAAPRFRDLDERRVVAAFLDWTRRVRPRFELTEATVFSRKQRYAGTLDAIVLIEFERVLQLATEQGVGLPEAWSTAADANGGTVRLIVDYKTGGDVEEGRGIWPEVALQLNAYAGAEFIDLPNHVEEPVPRVDGGLALQLGAAGWRMVPVRIGEDIYKAFLYAREVFRWVEQVSKTVLGDPIDVIFEPDEEASA